ncbi:hypothetical protein A3J44_04465 [candidate division WOR-1 bacterium RIFCSPHIGHO2_02_FULL_45_12]|nr:MAG: hypothetical protein A3J44_04465 [candidate division WOR-1 bacterium RIFCSPHIGHO2_02_FULL_45_12]
MATKREMLTQFQPGRSSALDTTWWQRHGSRALTWIFHKILKRPNRQALAESLKEDSSKLGLEQKKQLLQLLREHKLIYPKYTSRSIYDLPLEELKHYHLRKLISRKQLEGFIEAFNDTFKELFIINFSAGQFSVTHPPGEQSGLAIEPLNLEDPIVTPNLAAYVHNVLLATNRPLSFLEIKAEIAKQLLRGERIKEKDLGIAIGDLKARKVIFATSGTKKNGPRYFLKDRLDEVLHRTVYRYKSNEGETEYIYNKEANQLIEEGKAFALMDPDGHTSVMPETGFRKEATNYVQVKTLQKIALWVHQENIPELIEQGHLVKGLEDGTFAECYVQAKAQQHPEFACLIFNRFARVYLTRKYADNFDEKYAQLRAAFEARLTFGGMEPILDLLHEARTVASIGGNSTTVVIALFKHAKALPLLEETGCFRPDDLQDIEHCFRRFDFVDRFPLLFTPGYSYSLQNFIHFIYDQTVHFESFQLLLTGKLSSLRRLANARLPLVDPLRRQIELIYAPLAEKCGYIDLANNMRDFVAKLTDPEAYAATLAIMEKAMGMGYNQARLHVATQAAEIKAIIAENSGSIVSDTFTRIKEVAAHQKKNQQRGNREAPRTTDFMGIRYICKTVGEAYQIAAELQSHLDLAQAKEIPPDKKPIQDNLQRARKSGWQGWRGYFYDPSQNQGAAKRRVFSIQILTEEMLKEDKKGQSAHWWMKAARAAEVAGRELSSVYNQQHFDPPPIDEYTGNAEDDYYIDRSEANKYQRVFVYFDHWQDDSFSIKGSTFPGHGFLPMFRLGRGAILADAAAFRAFDTSLVTDVDFAEVYRFDQDGHGKIIFTSARQGASRAALTETVQNASLIVFKTGRELTEEELIKILRSTKSFRTSFLAKLRLELNKPHKPSREQIKTRGQDDPIAKKIDTAAKRQQIITLTGLRDENEVFEAIGLGLIDLATIEEALGILTTRVDLSTSGENLSLKIDTPDCLGLFSYILNQQTPEAFHILAASAQVITRAQGVSPATLQITLRPKGAKTPSLNCMQVRTDIENFHRRGETFTDRHRMGQETTSLKINLSLTNRGNWNILREIARLAAEFDFNILSFNLPNASESKDGEIIIEATQQAGTKEDIVEHMKTAFHEGLQSFKGFRFSLEEIS